MKIYLDLCAIQRPLDTPNQVRIALEAEAVIGIIKFREREQVELLSSEALLYEGEQSAWPIREEHTRAVLAKAKFKASPRFNGQSSRSGRSGSGD